MNECQLCGAPGGYPYCNEACREADMDEAEYEAHIGPYEAKRLKDKAAGG